MSACMWTRTSSCPWRLDEVAVLKVARIRSAHALFCALDAADGRMDGCVAAGDVEAFLGDTAAMRPGAAADLRERLFRELQVLPGEPVCFLQFVSAFPWFDGELRAVLPPNAPLQLGAPGPGGAPDYSARSAKRQRLHGGGAGPGVGVGAGVGTPTRGGTPGRGGAPVIERADLNLDDRAFRTPTLLSLDGGGMRGLVAAQVLVMLEDSIKQVLWKERLISSHIAEQLLHHAASRNVITEEQALSIYKKYVQPPASRDGVALDDPTVPRSDDWYKRQWADFKKRQSEVLDSPSDWWDVRRCFDIDIADFFDQLAGTSTGGLLALYLAARGGQQEATAAASRQALKSRPGSAAGASDFYRDNGAKIFGTSSITKSWRFLASAGRQQHQSAGLDDVLKGVFGDMTLDSLEDCGGANIVIPAVDVAAKRTAFFFHMSAKRRPPLYTSPGLPDHDTGSSVKSSSSGLATHLRTQDMPLITGEAENERARAIKTVADAQLVGYRKVLMRDPRRPGAPVTGAGETIGWLWPMVNFCLYEVPDERPTANSDLLWTNSADFEFVNAVGGFVAPMTFENLDFKLVDVARATSAAPAFLPPKVLRPVALEDGTAVDTPGSNLPKHWQNDRVFLDGGLANNDPTYLGLAQMLQRNNTARLRDCAILSIGTGSSESYDGFTPSKPQRWWKRLRGSLLRAVSWVVAGGTVTLLGGGKLGAVKCTLIGGIVDLLGILKIPKAVNNVGDLVSLTMDLNGEDKENMLRFQLYGLLHMPEGAYLRIQFKPTPSEWHRQLIDSICGPGNKGGDTAFKEEKELSDALGRMDDPSKGVLQAYAEAAKRLSEQYSKWITWWARCFIFGLEDASRFPFVCKIDTENTGNNIHGGKFLAERGCLMQIPRQYHIAA
ncbi:hypothetical protein HYH03_000902 [Edaphochlamys debaryana]|uniref:Patatin n=1 Tax=Edaphochlamys debaryana TaxID=47281 RepID=A0A836C6M6_9CHLO|nr:hypothetical protein HYH03_000902 [Edaphochlamys debaryana]|eukprot:KAG2501084.1 hypothetical protein HYH03_000902 [Edaphochlamys debaryana]